MKSPFAIALVCACSALALPARAFDSRCEMAGKPCVDGPVTAQTNWITAHSEHMQIWERVVAEMNLPAHLLATVKLRVPTVDEKVPGTNLSTVQGRPFFTTTRMAERSYKIAEMPQLPDLSYALWDWALGNERCPLDPRVPTVECHTFAMYMGAVNSNHFLPQARRFYEHYHHLAIDRASTCAEMRTRVGKRFAEFLEQCDQQALTFEAIGHHFLQDAWSSGHMWPRWGGPDAQDFGGEGWRERAILVAASAGMIHGSKGLLQPLLDDTGWPSSGASKVIGKPDVKDALCAPIDPGEFMCDQKDEDFCYTPGAPDFWQSVDPPSYVDGATGKKQLGIGDLYADEMASSPTYAAPWSSLKKCAQSSIREVVTAAGLSATVGDPAFPAPASAEYGKTCFGQQVTNSSLWLGAALDLIVHDVVNFDMLSDSPLLPIVGWIPIPNGTYDIYVRIPFDPQVSAKMVPELVKGLFSGWEKFERDAPEASAAELVINLTAGAAKVQFGDALKTQFRSDLASIAAHITRKARDNPNGTESAGQLPPLVGIPTNGNAMFQHPKPARYVDPEPPYAPRVSAQTGMTSDPHRVDALARAYNKAFAFEWCDAMTGVELEALKTTKPGHLCDVCGDFAGRHLRFGKTERDYDKSRPPLCELLGSTQFVYLAAEPDDKLSYVEHGKKWCGCRPMCEGGVAGRVVDANTGAPIQGAAVEHISATATNMMPTDKDGNFASESLPCGPYHLRVLADGYIPVELDVELNEDGRVVQVVQLKALDQACSGKTTSARGRVFDGFTDAPLMGATVELRKGVNTQTSQPVMATATTDMSGQYMIDKVPAGYYTATIAGQGFESSGPQQVSACSDTPQQDVHLIPAGEPGLSFVLNWARPADLDLHLLLPDGNEVAFDECAGALSQAPFAHFEVDHKMANGPESLRVGRFSPGVYTLYVHNYSAQNTGAEGFTNSEATVVVYQNSQPIRTLRVPTAATGYFWDVLEFEGTENSFQLHTVGTLNSRRANPFEPGAYTAVCTPKL